MKAIDALNLAREEVEESYIRVSTGLVKAAQADKKGAREALEKAQRAQVNGITQEIRKQNQNIPILQARQQAEKQVTQAYGTFYKDLGPAKTSLQKFTKNVQKTFPTLTKIAASAPGAIVCWTYRWSICTGAAQPLDQIAGVAQQFAFLAGAAASLGSQFSGLDSATQSAISETAGFAASIVGIGGTVVQMFTGMLSSGATEAAASLTSAAADNAEAAASSRAAAIGSGVGKTLGGVAVAAVAVISVFKFLQAQSNALADEQKKLTDSAIERLKSGGTANAADIRSGVMREIGNREDANAAGNAMFGGVVSLLHLLGRLLLVLLLLLLLLPLVQLWVALFLLLVLS